MKVLKHGKIGDLAHWKTVVSCGKKDAYDEVGCGAELEIAKEDLVLMYWHGTHFPHYYGAVKCPQCGKYNKVKDIPDSTWGEVATPKNKKGAKFDGFSEEL